MYSFSSMDTMKQNNISSALFPGSFDPFTLGHLDVVESALRIFGKVLIAVGHNHLKAGFMPTENRVAFIRDCIAGLVNKGYDIEVSSYSGLTTDFCRLKSINCIIRGVRTTADFESESLIAQANKTLDKNIQTIFIPTSPEYSFISSTVVRDVMTHGGDVKKFLPEGVDIHKYLR